MPTARDLNLIPADQITGVLNSITDVPGVLVGHQTIRRGGLLTGVTAVLPHSDNLFMEKVPASVHVINGFGKSVGLMQIKELGTIETPILLTNTFAVGTCANALIRRAIAQNPKIGRGTSTVNPVVCECNDGWLNDIQAMAVTEDDAMAALHNACDMTVVQGAVGAGTGMRCFGFKGGVGTASRRLELDGKKFNMGVLVLSNFGGGGDLILPGGRSPQRTGADHKDQGSIIIVLATDIPLDNRQLKRVSIRCGAGLARLGSYWGHGSGDIVVGFSTASRIIHDEKRDIISCQMLNEKRIDKLFVAAADCTQEAVLNSMLMAETTTGRDGHQAPSLEKYLDKLQ